MWLLSWVFEQVQMASSHEVLMSQLLDEKVGLHFCLSYFNCLETTIRGWIAITICESAYNFIVYRYKFAFSSIGLNIVVMGWEKIGLFFP